MSPSGGPGNEVKIMSWFDFCFLFWVLHREEKRTVLATPQPFTESNREYEELCAFLTVTYEGAQKRKPDLKFNVPSTVQKMFTKIFSISLQRMFMCRHPTPYSGFSELLQQCEIRNSSKSFWSFLNYETWRWLGGSFPLFSRDD